MITEEGGGREGDLNKQNDGEISRKVVAFWCEDEFVRVPLLVLNGE